MSGAHHILDAWREKLAAASRRMPEFDRNDGGAAARLLVLLETPGPGGDTPYVVTRDKGSGTARNLKRFLAEAEIARRDTIIWNTVPWIIHSPNARNRAPRRGEIAEGLAQLPSFLALLPRLTVAVLAGRVAREAAPVIARERPDVEVLTMPHPSPTYVCTSPAVPAAIRSTLAAAASALAST